jgi:uncharacterized protein (DUF2267 family)
MQYTSFVNVVEQVGGLTPEEADRAIEATLETLAERITGGEARDIAESLPKGMRGFLADTREEALPDEYAPLLASTA